MDKEEICGGKIQVQRDLWLPKRSRLKEGIRRVPEEAARRNSSRTSSKGVEIIMSSSFSKEITRRRFMTRVGQGVMAASGPGALLNSATAQLQIPDPPGKKLGWAIVGLGSLSIHQI